MKKKLSVLKINIILSLFIWIAAGSYSLLCDFDIQGYVFFALWFLTACLGILLLYKRYFPFLNNVSVDDNFIFFSDKYVYPQEIIKVYEVTPLEKLFFVLKSPEFDYTSTFLGRGLVVKTLYDSYLIDNISSSLIEHRKSTRRAAKKSSVTIFYLFSFLPVLLGAFKQDYLEYVSIAGLLVYLVILRLFPPFYLSKEIDPNTLPLSTNEVKEFKGITILEGFVFSDRLSTIPFKKHAYLDGLAIDIVFKKYIILNPRIFASGSEDYVRFVLFHELCHIKKHDSSGILLTLSSLTAIDIIFPFLPAKGIYAFNAVLPYYEYFLTAAAVLYILIVVIKNKHREKRADKYGLQAIGAEGCMRIYEKMGISLQNRIK